MYLLAGAMPGSFPVLIALMKIKAVIFFMHQKPALLRLGSICCENTRCSLISKDYFISLKHISPQNVCRLSEFPKVGLINKDSRLKTLLFAVGFLITFHAHFSFMRICWFNSFLMLFLNKTRFSRLVKAYEAKTWN